MTSADLNLPNYFLADMPPEAPIGAGFIREACASLRRNREAYLAARSTESVVDVLCELGYSWSQPDDRFRQLALQHGPKETGFPAPTIERGLQALFAEFKPEKFQNLLLQEFGHRERPERMVTSAVDESCGRATQVVAPELLVHITAGNIPNPSLMSLASGLLLRSAQFVKCARGSSFLPRLFAHSLYRIAPKLASCIEIAEWPGGTVELEDALYAEADLVTATGSDEALAAIQARLPRNLRWVGYGHRISFGFISQEALLPHQLGPLATQAAIDIASWNQQGCLSPHVLYVEHGGRIEPEKFAAELAAELERLEQTEPRGSLPDDDAAAIAARRKFYEVRAAYSSATRLWASQGSTAWTVVYENDPRFQASCLNRFVYVKGVANLTEVLQGADPIRGRVSTVGLAANGHRGQELVAQLARWGVSRICPIGRMQHPPLTWRHDGRPALADLVRWVDWERS